MRRRSTGVRLPFTGPAAGDQPRTYAPDAFDHIIAGMPADVSVKALQVLTSRNLDASRVYTLPLLTSATVTVPTTGAVQLNFQFPTLGVLYGMSWSPGNMDLANGDFANSLAFTLRDSAATVSIIGTESVPFNMSGIPTSLAQIVIPVAAGAGIATGGNYLRVTPWGVYQTNPLEGSIQVVSAGLNAPALVSVNLYGVGFWLPGQQIT